MEVVARVEREREGKIQSEIRTERERERDTHIAYIHLYLFSFSIISLLFSIILNYLFIHLGRYNENLNEDPKKWKANFRCAMNSLQDVKEDKQMSKKRGEKAYKVYKFLEEKPKKSQMKGMNGGES